MDLKDIHLPDAIGFFPFAYGWWVLLGVAIVLSLLLWWGYRKLIAPNPHKAAIQKLDSIMQNQQISTHEKLTHIASLMRQWAISTHLRSETAKLSGQQWLLWLDNGFTKDGKKDTPFTNGAGKILADGPYRPAGEPIDLDALVDLCKKRIQKG